MVEPQANGLPVAPDHLDATAQAEWDSIVPMLADMKLLGAVDAKAIANYCEAHSLNRQAKEGLKAITLAGDWRQVSQLTRIIRESDQLIKSWLIEFGCTPAARARMRIQPKEKPKEDKWSGVLKIS
jgi:P27 family predicted phage terminase small subunit